MPPALNLVCTRCTDHNHAALQRWYNDHAQLLMASPQLKSADLFKFDDTTALIDYFCLYHFASLDDFPAFDSGEVMGQVRDLSQAAPGRGSIEIVKRTQYERVLYRRWAAEQGAGIQASLLYLRKGSIQEAMRWMNDALYALHIKQPLQSAQVYAAKVGQQVGEQGSGHTELFVMLQSAAPLPADWHTFESTYAARADIKPVWQAQALRIAQWLR